MFGKMRKDPGFIIEPIKTGYSAKWEGHHATNPCSIRFSCDNRVFLGYRAGGDDDFYRCYHHLVWGSHLGLAVLNENGDKITCRLPLPIYTLRHGIPLPQTEAEFHEFMKGPHAKDILVLHDFRFAEYRDHLYLTYHEGPLHECYDCVLRMPMKEFIRRVDRSLELAKQPVEAIMEEWSALWWTGDIWEPCGYNGTNRIFPSSVCKGDVVYFELEDGTLQMCHRPLAYGVAVLNTGDRFHANATADGLTEYGVFETNTRPGYLDNSHIGNNGRPTRAWIGTKEVYIDVTHGCSRDMAMSRVNKPDIMYYAYLRIKDRKTGELLYWSEDPVIDYGPDWDSQALEGEWVRINPALRGVMFTGGQEVRMPGQNGADDEWMAYVGLGDTSVALARFTIRELVPAQVLADIESRATDLAKPIHGVAETTFAFPELINGWSWTLRNNTKKRVIEVVRTLPKTGEVAVREINSRPGYFDAHGLFAADNAVFFDAALGAWVVVYQGLRLVEDGNGKRTQAGHGILLLAPSNPEQILYRSMQPIMTEDLAGWNASCTSVDFLREHFLAWIPESVKRDLEYLKGYRAENIPFPSQMEKWQRDRAGL